MTNSSTREHKRFSRPIVAALFAATTMIILSACSGGGGGGSSSNRSIAGTITSGGSALAGVTVTLGSGSSDSTTTDANGKFKFDGLAEDDYSVTPSLAAPGFLVFSPPFRTAYLNGNNGTGFDFTVTSFGTMATTTHSVFLDNDGTVWTWGDNSNGQLGNGTTADRALPGQGNGLTGIRVVSAGNGFTLALKNDGTVWAWGINGNGQLGDGTRTDSTVPVPVTGFSGMEIVAIAAGFDHAVAVRSDGTVWAWGSNSYLQLGQGKKVVDSVTPVQVSGLGVVTAVSAGNGFTLALRDGKSENGTVMAWGRNTNGQLGNGKKVNSATPVQVSGLIKVLAISAGNDHSVALMNQYTASTAWTWGMNTSGQLGNGTVKDSTTPVKVKASEVSNLTAVAAGFDHTVAVSVDGTVWAWGNNSHGQLGVAEATLADSTKPVQVSGLSDSIAVVAGNGDAIVQKSDGTLLAWGNNSNGQLGNGTTTDSPTPVPVHF